MSCVSTCAIDRYKQVADAYEQMARDSLSSEIFWRQLSSVTENIIRFAKEIFAQQFSELASLRAAVVCTGSDGRLEKCGLGSPVECIVVLSAGDALQHTEIIEKIERICRLFPSVFYPQVDKKIVGKDLVSTYEKEGIDPRIIPTRAFDALFLGGDPALFEQYRGGLFEELRNQKIPLNVFIKTFLRDSFQNLRSELSGISRKKPLLDLKTGVVYYEKNKGRGLKHDALRAIQYGAAAILFAGVGKGKISQQEMESIPRTVLGRIRWLKERQLMPLSSAECVEVEALYTQVSYWYVQLNVAVMQRGNPSDAVTEFQLPPEQLKAVIQKIQVLSEKMAVLL